MTPNTSVYLHKLSWHVLLCHVVMCCIVELICYDLYAMSCDDFLYVFGKSSHLPAWSTSCVYLHTWLCLLCYVMSLCACCRFDMLRTLCDDFLYEFRKSSRLHETKIQFTYILCHARLWYFYRSVPVVDSICYDPYMLTCDDFLYVLSKSSHLHETHLEDF